MKSKPKGGKTGKPAATTHKPEKTASAPQGRQQSGPTGLQGAKK